MKKFAKITAGIVLVAAIATTAGVLAGCNKSESESSPKNGTGEAYGLVHNGGYVGYSKIVYVDDAVTALTLTEVCFPTEVKATEGVAENDRVTVTTTNASSDTTTNTYYYKTVSYGNVTLTFDADAKSYMVDSQTLANYLASEANCKAYYEAVMNNQIKVTVGGEQKTDIMTKATLSKDENGYWSTATNVGASKVEGDSKWKANRDATVDYVKANGTSKLKKLAKNDNGFWTDGTVTTGATWNDLNPSDKKGKTYYTYAELILKAEAALK